MKAASSSYTSAATAEAFCRNCGENEAFGFCGQLVWGGERQWVLTAAFI